MYRKNVFDRIKFLIYLYENKLYRNQDTYKAYLSLTNLNDIYSYITGYELFNDIILKNKSPIIYRMVMRESDKYRGNYIENIKSLDEFSLEVFPAILEVLDDYSDLLNREVVLNDELSREQWIDIIKEFSEEEMHIDKNHLNKMVKDLKIITGHDAVYFGCSETLSDYIRGNDFIYIDSNGDNNENAFDFFHEDGHFYEELEMDGDLKLEYDMLSLFSEVESHYFENKAYDFLIRKNIIKEEAISNKIELLKDLYDFSNDYLKLLNEGKYEEMKEAVLYSYGILLALYFCNSDEKNFLKFDVLHRSVYDFKLFEEMDINKEKLVKSLKKEIRKLDR